MHAKFAGWIILHVVFLSSADFLFKIDFYKYIPCENEVGFIGTVLELSGTHFNGTFWDNHLIPINPNVGIIWY